MSDRRRKSRMTLHLMQMQEMLLAMGLGMVIAGWAMQTAFRSWTHCRAATDRLVRCGETMILRDAWRGFIHACPEAPRKAEATVVQAGRHKAEIQPGTLLLSTPEDTRRFPVPEGVALSFDAVRGDQGSADLWLLRVESAVTENGKAHRHSVDIVACRRPVATPKENGP